MNAPPPPEIPDLSGEIEPEQKFGSAVKNGKLHYLSVSQIMKFNPEEDGCNLRFFYRYVMGRQEPQRAFNEKGGRLHSQNEFYLATGSDVRGKLALEGRHLLPAPGPDLLVEWGLNDKPRPPPKDGKQVSYYPPKESIVFANDVPLIGFGDLIDPRQRYVNDEGEHLVDMPGTVDVTDYKTTSKLENAKPAASLIHITQMLGYGKFVTKKYPWATHVRLRHVYYLTKKPTGWGDKPLAFARSAHVTIASINEAWEKRTGNLVEQIKRVAAAKNEREVQGNTAACTAFGGCPHQRNCYVFQSLSVKQKLELQYGSDITTKQEKKMNDLMARVRAAKNGSAPNGAVPAAPAANAAPAAAPAVPAPPPPPAPNPNPGLTANKATQGQPYQIPAHNNAVFVFLSAVDQQGTIAYSFLPVAGGQPVALVADETIVPLAQFAAPAAAAAPVPTPAPSGGTPPPPPPWVPAPPAGPVPTLASGRPHTQIQDKPSTPPAPVGPPPPAAPSAAAAATAAADGRSKAAREAKKAQEIADAAAKAAAAAAAAPGKIDDKVARLCEAIDVAKEIYKDKFGTEGTPDQLLPIWLALLND